jgi:serine/threonine protein kinase
MSAWPSIPPRIGKYLLGRTLGRGSFALVMHGEHSETHIEYAIKLIPRTNIMSDEALLRFEREVRVILKMKHPGVIKVYDFLNDADFLYLIMELVTGNTLLSSMLMPGSLTEDVVKPIFKQLLVTVAYIHEQGIAHRDLKLENVLVNARGQIKIVDFGFSRCAQSPGELFATSCGSPAYAAPEVIEQRRYEGSRADMWSLGVMLYGMVTGTLPWRGNNQQMIYEQISHADYEIPATVSVMCKSLIQSLMVVDPAVRYTAPEAVGHPWLEGVEAVWEETTVGVKPSLTVNTFVRLLNLSSQSAGEIPCRRAESSGAVVGARIARAKQFAPSRGGGSAKIKRFAPGALTMTAAGTVVAVDGDDG